MSFEMFIAIGTALMLVVMLVANRHYGYHPAKVILAGLLLTAAGIIGAKLMAMIESGIWGGKSFYGALFFAPLIMLPVALALRIPYSRLMDLCAPAECVMLALLKVQCLYDGCCFGRLLGISSSGRAIRFPSQIVECVSALLLMAVLLIIIRRGRAKGTVYPWYMVLYGVMRFILNLFRETTPFIWILPAGNFWSLVSLVLGGALLLIALRRRGRAAGAPR